MQLHVKGFICRSNHHYIKHVSRCRRRGYYKLIQFKHRLAPPNKYRTSKSMQDQQPINPRHYTRATATRLLPNCKLVEQSHVSWRAAIEGHRILELNPYCSLQFYRAQTISRIPPLVNASRCNSRSRQLRIYEEKGGPDPRGRGVATCRGHRRRRRPARGRCG